MGAGDQNVVSAALVKIADIGTTLDLLGMYCRTRLALDHLIDLRHQAEYSLAVG